MAVLICPFDNGFVSKLMRRRFLYIEWVSFCGGMRITWTDRQLNSTHKNSCRNFIRFAFAKVRIGTF